MMILDRLDQRKQMMSSSVVTQEEEKPVARPLTVLVSLIKEDLKQEKEASAQAAMPHRIAAGVKMIEARDGNSLKGRELYDWTKRHFNLSSSSVRTYIKLAETEGYGGHRAIPRAKPFTSLEDFKREHLRSRSSHKSGRVLREWREPVDDIAERARREALRIRDAELSRQQEREAERTLALRLIDIGFKVLVKELHPDKGGSRDAMSRLNRVRDRLKQHA